MSQYYGIDKRRLTIRERKALTALDDDTLINLRCALVKNFRLVIQFFKLAVKIRFTYHNKDYVIEPSRETVWIDDYLNNKFDPTLWKRSDVLDVANNFDEFLKIMMDVIFASVNPICFIELYKKVAKTNIEEVCQKYLQKVDPCGLCNDDKFQPPPPVVGVVGVLKKVNKDEADLDNSDTITSSISDFHEMTLG